ncbi:hypothetical protein DIZ76_014328 [Coccidioides immitis]|nr:hypothetical protein DIZ76_014328 [Coccidioides immitis]
MSSLTEYCINYSTWMSQLYFSHTSYVELIPPNILLTSVKKDEQVCSIPNQMAISPIRTHKYKSRRTSLGVPQKTTSKVRIDVQFPFLWNAADT